MEISPPRYYLVRTKRVLIEKGVIGIGWSRINFSDYTNQHDLLKAISSSGYKLQRSRPAILRFFGMKSGDIIIAPLAKSIAIGYVTEVGNLIYAESNEIKDRSNQRKIKFLVSEDNKLLTIARNRLEHAFQKNIRVPGGIVKDVTKFKDQIDKAIESIQLGKPMDKKTWLRLEDGTPAIFKANLLKNINNGKTYLPAGGIGLEQLVKELFAKEGYDAKVLGKRHFKGFADADIEATRTCNSKSTRFLDPKLLIQVKHHQGTTGSWGVKQLEKISMHHAKYIDHKLILITSAQMKGDLRQKANAAGITVVEGAELVDWVFDHIQDLSCKMKAVLGIAVEPST